MLKMNGIFVWEICQTLLSRKLKLYKVFKFGVKNQHSLSVVEYVGFPFRIPFVLMFKTQTFYVYELNAITICLEIVFDNIKGLLCTLINN